MMRHSVMDVCNAWRADYGNDQFAPGADELHHQRRFAWLQILTVFARISSIPIQERASYARRSAPVWRAVRQVTGEDRYSEVEAVMESWIEDAPGLSAFRELLWAVEQIEADGGTFCSLSALGHLRMLVPDGDIRGAYAVAQSGRALRSLGKLDEAEDAFSYAGTIAERRADDWLRVRVMLGHGVICHARGNYPEARQWFTHALREAGDRRDLRVGAHLGIVSAAHAASNVSDALEHGWAALRIAAGVRRWEIEALTLLAAAALEVPHYEAALRCSLSALAMDPPKHHRHSLLRAVLLAAVGCGKADLVDEYQPKLRADVANTRNPWERALGHRVLGDVSRLSGNERDAREHYDKALSIAVRHGYHEIEWQSDQGLTRLGEHSQVPSTANGAVSFSGECLIKDNSAAVLASLAAMPVR